MQRKSIIGIALAGVVVVGIAVAALLAGSSTPEQAPPTTNPNEKAPSVVKSKTDLLFETIFDDSAPMADRIRALGKINRPLTTEEVAKLKTAALNKKYNETFRNDVLVLLERHAQPSWLGKELVKMWNDETDTDRMRDYAVQHFVPAFEFSTDKGAILKTLKDVASSGGRVAGTALISLDRMSEKHPELAEVTVRLAGEILNSDKKDAEAAVTAMQIVRRNSETEMARSTKTGTISTQDGKGRVVTKDSILDTLLIEARKIAVDSKAMARLRMSAIGTLGEHGNNADLKILQSLTTDKESRVSRVAKYQSKQLQKKLGVK